MRLLTVTAALTLAGVAAFAQGTVTMERDPNAPPGDPDLPTQSTAPISEAPAVPGDPWLRENVLVGVSSNEVFDHHDANGDGVLDKDEFGRALHFNPVFDCVDPSTATDDPRCMRWRAVRGR